MMLELISAAIGILGIIFITFKNKIGFLVWIVGNILWIVYGFTTKQYFFMVQYVVFTIFAVYGFGKWLKEDVMKNKTRRKKK